jgi:4-hydroxy-2-oxoheptanedioate aldolase
MAERSFRARVLARETLLGCFVTWPTEGLLDLVALGGFDFVVLDTEHGYFGADSMERMIRAADAAGLPAVVRVPNCRAAADAGRALDAGAAGTLFPRADGIAAVRGAVESAKYPPAGRRGLAGVRANRYGTIPLGRWVVETNASTAVVVQIETVGALETLSDIAGESGVDVLFVGPNDLSQALGVPGRYDDPRYGRAVEAAGGAARRAGKAAGIMLQTAEQVPALAASGYTVFTTSDRALVSGSAAAWRTAVPRS